MAERHDKTPSRGLGRWLTAAPPSASFEDVCQAYQEYDDPSDVWPDGNYALVNYEEGSS